jgi:predicted porin
MRKVLLATTALVAMGGVSAAAADVSLSGVGRYTYSSWSDNDTSGDDTTGTTDVLFTVSGASTADSGMTMGGSITLLNGDTDAQSIYVSDDWGKLTFGGADAARGNHNSASVGAMPGSNGDQAFANVATNSRVGNGANDKTVIKYTSPDFNGLVVNASVTNAGGKANEEGDISSWAVSYGTDFEGASVALDYASASTANAAGTGTTTDADSIGATVTVDDLTIMVGSANTDKSDGSSKIATTDYGVDYAVNSDLTVEAWAVSSKNTGTGGGANDKLSMTQVGATYTVTPGLTVSLTSRSFDYKDASDSTLDNKGDGVTARVTVTF